MSVIWFPKILNVFTCLVAKLICCTLCTRIKESLYGDDLNNHQSISFDGKDVFFPLLKEITRDVYFVHWIFSYMPVWHVYVTRLMILSSIFMYSKVKSSVELAIIVPHMYSET